MTPIDLDAHRRTRRGQTVLACRGCGETWGVETTDDGSCLNCGLGVVDPSDRPAGVPVPASTLPIGLGGGPHFACDRCGCTFTPPTWHVEIPSGPNRVVFICRSCSLADSELVAWQLLCDLSDEIDRLMQRADGPDQRRVLAQLIASHAEHFADWRWPPSAADQP